MIEKLIEALLPGTRSLRPPLIAGILWGLFFWIVFSEHIPLANESKGWAHQFYIMLGAVGPIVSVGVASIMVFVLGALLVNVSDVVSGVVGKVSLLGPTMFAWQIHAQRSYGDLKKKVASATEQVDDITKLVEEEKADRADKRGRSEAEKSLVVAKEHLREAENDVENIKRVRRKWLWIPNHQQARTVLGDPPARAYAGLESELVGAARSDGQHAMMDEKSVYFAPQIIGDPRRARTRWINADSSLDREFISEIEGDPLQVLQSLSEPLFLDMDRRRAEREVRLAFATPMMAFVAWAAVHWSNAWCWVLILVPLGMVVRYSFEQAQERTEVLRLMRLNTLRTPALRRAFEHGRRDVLREIEKRGNGTVIADEIPLINGIVGYTPNNNG